MDDDNNESDGTDVFTTDSGSTSHIINDEQNITNF